MIRITQKDKEFVKDAIKENYISKKDTKLLLYCWLLLKHGWKKHKEIAEALKLKHKADKWFDNLKKSGYFAKDGKIRIELEYPEVEFAIMMNVAEGHIRRAEK